MSDHEFMTEDSSSDECVICGVRGWHDAGAPVAAVKSTADIVWEACERRCEELRNGLAKGWVVRDIVILAEEDFADNWATTWSFGIFDPDHVKELARWISQYLAAAGVLAEGRI